MNATPSPSWIAVASSGISISPLAARSDEILPPLSLVRPLATAADALTRGG